MHAPSDYVTCKFIECISLFQLSEKYGIPFFETSAHSNVNIEKVSMADTFRHVFMIVKLHLPNLLLGFYRNVSVNTGPS